MERLSKWIRVAEMISWRNRLRRHFRRRSPRLIHCLQLLFPRTTTDPQPYASPVNFSAHSTITGRIPHALITNSKLAGVGSVQLDTLQVCD